MAGLVAGACVSVKIMSKLKNLRLSFILTQVALSLYPLILPALFQWLGGSRAGIVSQAGGDLIFTALPILAGFVGGFQFPLASTIYISGEGEIGKGAGMTYGIDLAGSCLGALFTGALLIPVLGVPASCLALAGLNLAILAGLFFSFRRYNE